jgi:hypothetical protein
MFLILLPFQHLLPSNASNLRLLFLLLFSSRIRVPLNPSAYLPSQPFSKPSAPLRSSHWRKPNLSILATPKQDHLITKEKSLFWSLQLLRHYGDALELLDVSSQLPALKRRPGLTKWLVRDKRRWYSNYSQVEPPRNGGAKLVPTMFPSAAAPPVAATERQVADEPASEAGDPGLDKDGEAVKEKDVQEGGRIEVAGEGVEGARKGEEREEVVPEAEESGLPLHRSMRVVPHDQDTGGFFVAVFRKLKHLEGEGSGWFGSGLCTIWL